MSKLSFRARALDVAKPMPIYMAEELPDLPDYSAINRAVPQMPSGMEKEEECEHHLQRAICAGLIIPTPEVADMPDRDFYNKIYPANYKQPRQLIHMQPFSMEQDIPDYDMDSEDERWLQSQTSRLDLSPLKFEEMMDRLEKSSGQTVVNLNEAKALLKEDDDLIIAVFDYWLNKRLKTQHTLIPSVKTEQRSGAAPNNPYLAFRRRTEKMQTRKHRKNDETSYEKMLKLRRDLHRAVTLLELVKKREKMKRELVQLTVEVYEKRYYARDFSGAIYAEAAASKAATATRPAFTPIFHNHYGNQGWSNKAILKDEVIPRKEKRQYKKRKHKSLGNSRSSGGGGLGGMSSDDEQMAQMSAESEEAEDEGQFAFRRNKLCSYHMPLSSVGNWPWCSRDENGLADPRFRFTLTSVSHPRRRCIGFARRRMGRGGRVILDRIATDNDDFWRSLDFSIVEPMHSTSSSSSSIVKIEKNEDNSISDRDFKCEFGIVNNGDARTNGCAISVDVMKHEEIKSDDADEKLEILRHIQRDWLHFRPKTPPFDYSPPCTLQPTSDSYFVLDSTTPFSIEVQTLENPGTLLDASVFETDPFTFDNLDCISDVPVTDTRQQQLYSGDNLSKNNVQQKPTTTTGINLNVNVGLNTLTSSVINDSSNSCNSVSSNMANNSAAPIVKDDDVMMMIDGVVADDENVVDQFGSSRFHVSDLNVNQLMGNPTNTGDFMASPKVNITSTRRSSNTSGTAMGNFTNTNGLLSQFGLDGKTKNKIPCPYSGGIYQPATNNASSGTLSLHTSTHTLTLNSHSANILEIPITDDTEPIVSNKLVNSQCTDSSSTTPVNNKTKTIVRKNNLVMEVT